MEKKKKILLVVLIVVVIAIVVFFWPKNKDKYIKNAAESLGYPTNNNGGTAALEQYMATANNTQPGNTGGYYNPAPVPAYTPPNTGSGGGGFFNSNQSSSMNAQTGSLVTGGIGASVVGILSSPTWDRNKFPLKLGSKGNEVKEVQAAVNTSISRGMVNGAALTVDGVWGAKTDAAVRQVIPSGTIYYDRFVIIDALNSL